RLLIVLSSFLLLAELPDAQLIIIVEDSGWMSDKPAVPDVIRAGHQFNDFFLISGVGNCGIPGERGIFYHISVHRKLDATVTGFADILNYIAYPCRWWKPTFK